MYKMAKLKIDNDKKTKIIIRRVLLVILVIFCPVLTTDFMVAGGITPISYIVFYSVIWFHPLMLIYLFEAFIYLVIFNFFLRFLFKYLNNRKSYFVTLYLIFLILIIISLFPTYIELAHNPGESKNIISLFSDEYNSWITR